MNNNDEYQNLIVWQKAMDLCEVVYESLNNLPQIEQFALADQMRRAVISIPSNIAEGMGRGTNKETLHFLYISKGSLYELETQIQLCYRLKYIDEDQSSKQLLLAIEIKKMLNKLIEHRKNQ